MPITYTNRKGRKYFLCEGVTKSGKPRYYFSNEKKDNVLDEIPAGYEITESVNGIVSLSKVRANLLLDTEINTIRAAIEKHPETQRYRIDIKSKAITIYEQEGPDLLEIAAILVEGLGPPGAIPEDIKKRLEKEHNIYTQYTPVVRFTLRDKEKRLFGAERMCYLGSVDDWIDVAYGKTVEELADAVIPALGTDEFYELR
jgi:hypothetical protein